MLGRVEARGRGGVSIVLPAGELFQLFDASTGSRLGVDSRGSTIHKARMSSTGALQVKLSSPWQARLSCVSFLSLRWYSYR
jgi:hypothetical protein